MTVRDTNRAFPIALLRARETFMDHVRPVLAKHGCTEQQWRVLRTLQEIGPCDATELARRSCVLSPSMTRLIRTLDERGLVTRRSDTNDNRRLHLDISEKGREFIGRVSPEIEEIYDRLERAFGGEKMESLLDMLEELVRVSQLVCTRSDLHAENGAAVR